LFATPEQLPSCFPTTGLMNLSDLATPEHT
jgi:hypothetical protein